MDFLSMIGGATGSLFLTLISFLVVLTVVVFVFVGFVADTRGPGMVGASGIVAALLMIFGPF